MYQKQHTSLHAYHKLSTKLLCQDLNKQPKIKGLPLRDCPIRPSVKKT